MKRVLPLILALVLIVSLSVAAFADSSKEKKTPEEYYTIGATEDTFKGLYEKMCVKLDIKDYPIPEPDTDGNVYGTDDYERIFILKDDTETYEWIGYVYDKHDKPLYIVRSWTGYHEEGVIIQMQVYYDLKGEYIGNIQWDLTNGLSNSSSRMPYYIPSQGTHKLK